MTIVVTLTSSTIEDPTLYFDLTIDGEICATIPRSFSNANIKTLITAAYDRGVAVTTAAQKFDPVLDDL